MPPSPWPGCCRSGRGAPRPFGGFPWARLAFSQADGPLAPFARFGGAPGVTFAVASLGVLLHLPPRARPPGRAAARSRRRGIPVLAVVLVAARRWRRSGSPWPPPRPPTGARCRCCSSRATCPSRAWTSTPSGARSWTTTSRAPSVAVAHRAPGPEPGRVAGELLGHRPAAQPRRRRRHPPRRRDRQGAASWSARSSTGRARTSPTRACSTARARPTRSATSSSTRCRSPSTSRYRSFFRNFSDKVDLVTRDFASGRPGRAASRCPWRGSGPTGSSRRSASRWPTTT